MNMYRGETADFSIIYSRKVRRERANALNRVYVCACHECINTPAFDVTSLNSGVVLRNAMAASQGYISDTCPDNLLLRERIDLASRS